MGYYTGKGVVTGGGESVQLRDSGPAVGGAYYLYIRTVSLANVKNGVSLETAKGAHADMNMTYWQWPGGAVSPNCRGTRKLVQYSQINGSNLYSLTVTDETVQCRGKQAKYDSGWIS